MADDRTSAATTECDVLVVGSGAAGLTAALTAAHAGLSVIVLEKAPVIGGSTALSEGMVWIPGSRQARAAGTADTTAQALAYIAHAAGPLHDPARASAFLEAAPRMLAFVEDVGGLSFTLTGKSMDYHPDWPGASRGARSLIPGIFSGRRLGKRFENLRRPLESTMVFGGMTIGSGELPTMLKAHRDLCATWHAARLVARHVLDRACGYSRGTRIANGNGLIAALAVACLDHGVTLRTEVRLSELLVEPAEVGKRVVGGIGSERNGSVRIRARRGVVLASGGFSGNPALRRRFFPQGAAGDSHVRLVPESIAGDGLRMAETLRANVIAGHNVASWAPTSRVPLANDKHRDGYEGFPHFLERQKPGLIAVNRRGRRFVNEATSYSLFVQAMLADSAGGEPECWLLADRVALRKYGIGPVPPFPLGIGAYLRSGYLVEAPDLLTLAARLGIEVQGLVATVETFNRHAREGCDPEFGRGSSEIDRAYGDPKHLAHPNLGPLQTPPFYAVRIHTGDIGSLAGLATDQYARVLDAHGQPIPGLFAAGNDAASLFGGSYPAGGITIGPSMTFGWVAARYLAAGPNGCTDCDD